MKFRDEKNDIVSDKTKEASKDFLNNLKDAVLGDPIAAGRVMIAIAKSPFFIREQIFWRKFSLFLDGVYLSEEERRDLRVQCRNLRGLTLLRNGYFAIISSEKMDAKKAIGLYKNRDASEKVFRTDKSYLGNHCLRVASEEAASNKIFVGFIVLIIRCRLYTALKNKASEMVKKPNYLTVPAAIRELEKIEITRQLDKIYRLDHAVSKTQKVILDAFGIRAEQVKYKSNYISEQLKGK